MSTQYYGPQQTAPPPAAPGRAPRPAKWTPQAGVRNTPTLDTIPGRLVPSHYGDGVSEVVFEVDGGRPWYVPQVIADAIYRTGVRAGEQIEVTVTGRKKTDLLILPVQPRLAGGAAHSAPPAAGSNQPTRIDHTPPPPEAPAPKAASPQALCMCRAMCAAVDAVIETQQYATRKGLGLTFGEESVRAIGLSIYINTCREGGRS